MNFFFSPWHLWPTGLFFNPFLANVPILHPLKTLENLCFTDVFREYKMETLARNGLKICMIDGKFSPYDNNGFR